MSEAFERFEPFASTNDSRSDRVILLFFFVQSVPITFAPSSALFFQPFCGNDRNWIFRNLEFREKFLEFSEKILQFREKIA